MEYNTLIKVINININLKIIHKFQQRIIGLNNKQKCNRLKKYNFFNQIILILSLLTKNNNFNLLTSLKVHYNLKTKIL